MNFNINVAINGGKTGWLNGVVGATIDNVTVSVLPTATASLTDWRMTITNAVTSNNAWGGLAVSDQWLLRSTVTGIR